MKICIVTECELARSHGTGSQLLELFDRGGVPYHHFYWHCGHHVRSESRHSTYLGHVELAVPALRGSVRHVLRAVGRSWWRKNVLNAAKFRRLLRRRGLAFDAAYVAVAHETAAARANDILRALRCPYVVHIMDIYHADGLDPNQMPQMARLLRNAHGLLALDPPIRSEMAKFVQMPIQQVAIGQPAHVDVAVSPRPGEPLRIALTGRPYRGGCELLAQSYTALNSAVGPVEIVSAGRFEDLPVSLKPLVTDGGFLGSDNYRRLLARCHLAFLSGPSELDCFGKYSFPSRCADYLMAGLPVLACAAAGSAVEQFLAPLIPRCVAITRTTEALVKAIGRLTASDPIWSDASVAARQFAVAELNIDSVRARILRALDLARVGSVPAEPQAAGRWNCVR